MKFGRLTLIERVPNYQAKCVCECGKEVVVRYDHLINGDTKSCGCLNQEIKKQRALNKLKAHIGKEYETLYSKIKILDYSAKFKVQCLKCNKIFEITKNQFYHKASCPDCRKKQQKVELEKISDPKSKWNDKPTKHNKSGIRGVTFISKKGLWRADIGVGGKKIYLGSYSSKEEALKIRKQAEKKYWIK